MLAAGRGTRQYAFAHARDCLPRDAETDYNHPPDQEVTGDRAMTDYSGRLPGLAMPYAGIVGIVLALARFLIAS